MDAIHLRRATAADLPALEALMTRAIDALQAAFLTPEQVVASHSVMGLDTQLIADGTYWIAEIGGVLAGGGGWSRRATLYGGDTSAVARVPRLLDAAHEAARIRAMYTDPGFTRRGVGRAILDRCEAEARAEGFAEAMLMATLAGEPLYRAAGYRVVERVIDRVPLVAMAKSLS